MRFIFSKIQKMEWICKRKDGKTAVSTPNANRSRLLIVWVVARELRERQQKLFSLECFPPDRLFQ